MNRTEHKRAIELDALKQAGKVVFWAYESVTLALAPRTRYTPDFFIIDDEYICRFEEIKGFWRDDARVKIKLAAKLFPHFTFVALTPRKGGTWNSEEFPNA